MKNVVNISGAFMTQESRDSLNSYLREISLYPLLTREEEIELFKKIRKGDKDARNKIINSNLRFVVSVAKNFQSRQLSLSDLINEGNIGLIESVNKFDETKGFKFISCAVWWIRQAILFSIDENERLIRLPRSQLEKIKEVKRISSKFEQENGYKMSIEEMSETTGLKVDDIIDIYDIDAKTKYHISLDDSSSDYDNKRTPLVDFLPSPQEDEKEDIPMSKISKFLKNEEVDILKMFLRFGIDDNKTKEVLLKINEMTSRNWYLRKYLSY